MNLYLDEQNGGVTTLAQSYNREPIEIEGDPGVLCTDSLVSQIRFLRTLYGDVVARMACLAKMKTHAERRILERFPCLGCDPSFAHGLTR
jgi:hypothetical protein